MTVAFALLSLLQVTADAPPEGPLPSAREILDGYRKNFDAFRTLKVRWRRDSHRLDAWVAIEAKTFADEEASLAKLDPSSPAYDEAQKSHQMRRTAMAQYRGPTAVDQTFLTNRVGFQMRSLAKPFLSATDDKSWGITDAEPLGAARLDEVEAGVSVVSHTGNPADGFRIWIAQPKPVVNYGQITAANSPSDLTQFPPLGVSKPSWGQPLMQWNPIDLFFHAPAEKLQVVGRATLDGHATVIVENPADPVAPHLPQGQAQMRWVDRAHLDPARGWLPLRIERFHEQVRDGQVVPGSRQSQPEWALEDVEITLVPGAGYYPTKGAFRRMDGDPNWTGEPDKRPSVPYEEIAWRVVKIEANVPIREDFRLPFPKDTQYWDQRTGETFISGREDEDGTTLPWGLCGAIVVGWVVFGCVAAARAALAKSRREARSLEPPAAIL